MEVEDKNEEAGQEKESRTDGGREKSHILSTLSSIHTGVSAEGYLLHN
jgi:hypothetical protein